MFWLLSRLVVWPVKAVTGTAKVTTKAGAKTAAGSFKAGYRTGRLLGYRRLVLLGAGVGVGLLVAPKPGRELREQVRSRLEEQGLLQPKGGDLSSSSSSWPLASSSHESPSPLPDVAAAAAVGGDGSAAGAEAEAA
ncbi:MAG: YtxH domain-containing protein, partial [Acidimicrobiia bacterium]|nr:YtxH domain-containing protein [Acidimicrobiia bacterium]